MSRRTALSLAAKAAAAWITSNRLAALAATAAQRAAVALAAAVLAQKEADARLASSPPNPSVSNFSTIIQNFVGTLPTVADVTAIGTNYDTWINSRWTVYEAQHYTEAAGWGTPFHEHTNTSYAVYARPRIYWERYVMLLAADPTTAATYLTKAVSFMQGWRESDGAPSGATGDLPNEAWNTQWLDMGLHYLINGNSAVRDEIGAAGDYAAYLVNAALGVPGSIRDKTKVSNRYQADVFDILYSAWKTNAPSVGASGPAVGSAIPSVYATWLAALQDWKTQVLSTQDADGGWTFTNNDGNSVPFQIALICDRLRRYYEKVSADSDVLAAIKLSMGFVHTKCYHAPVGSFFYMDGVSPGQHAWDGSNDGTTPTTDLHLWIAPIEWWLYYMTGDITWRNRADPIFDLAVAGDSPGADGTGNHNEAYLYGPSGYKQWAEQFTVAMTAIRQRGLTPIGSTSQVCSVAPAITGLGTGTLSCSTGTWSGSPTFTRQWWKYNAATPIVSAGTGATLSESGLSGLMVKCVVKPNGDGTPNLSNLVTVA